jgi:retron-type reverse transcriptase
VLETALRTGVYRPGPHREIRIPKGPGRGTRTLRIQDVEDRVVQRAVVQVAQPYLDPILVDASLGYRPGRRREHALAMAEALAAGRWVWVTEDIRDAFDNVPLGRLMDALRVYLPAAGVLKLVETVIAGDGRRGLRQGGALSPLLLNIYLHHLGLPWGKERPETALVRVADDLLLLCRDRQQAAGAREALADRLRPVGMTLKGATSAIVGLATGEDAAWLGFDLRKGKEGLEARLPREGEVWASLDEALGNVQVEPDAPIRARGILRSWVE